MVEPAFDVVVVGASLAGCTAAALYARRGLSVALLESSPDEGAYKKVCSHFIQASATPTLQRLGLAERLEAAGAVRNSGRLWTRAGWFSLSPGEEAGLPEYGYSLRREKLDPLVREWARDTPGVTLRMGHSARELLRSPHGSICGVEGVGPAGAFSLRARLVVGADGRRSKIAQLAGIEPQVLPHNRFGYMAYYRNLPLAFGNDAQLWLLEPDIAYAFPNDGGQTLLACFVSKARLADFRRDLEGQFVSLFDALPDGPAIRKAERVSSFIGMIDLPNLYRRPTAPGLALVGDAALASDPVWGVGCGWAFRSAEWLVEHTADAIREPASLRRGLARYRKEHKRRLLPIHRLNAGFSVAGPMDPVRRWLFSTAPHEPKLARHIGRFTAERVSVFALVVQGLWRVLWSKLTTGRRPSPIGGSALISLSRKG
jgi:2-polyprenyl-6-methoxyphenol hydroxylase-like FAD-dependent oxidoreductase